MQIGAILSLAEDHHSDGFSAGVRSYSRKGNRFLGATSRTLVDVLGQNLLERSVGKLQSVEVASVRVLPGSPATTSVLPARSAKTNGFIAAWETAVTHYLTQGVELLLLVRVGAYFDLDYRELLQFHLERRSRLTQVYRSGGSLDIAMVDAAALRGTDFPYRKVLSALMPEQERFFYQGYFNPMNHAHDFRALAEDGLNERCGLQPVGTEVTAGVWQGAEARVEDSAVIEGPAFIGARSRVADCCRITGSSSIERDCVIDCGTDVDQSCVLQGTYVGVALSVHRSIVNEKKLFHLDRNIEVGISDKRLIGAAKPMPLQSEGTAALYGALSQSND